MNKKIELAWGMRILLGLGWVWSISLIVAGSMLMGANRLLDKSPWLIVSGLIINIIIIESYIKNENKYFAIREKQE